MSTTTPGDTLNTQRIDKWLWVARFYKTRSLASAALAAGHVKLNDEHAKAASKLHRNDKIELNMGNGLRFTLHVRAFNTQRRPACEAQQLYQETPESQAQRAAHQEAMRLAPSPGADLRGRPSKRDRRHIHAFKQAQNS